MGSGGPRRRRLVDRCRALPRQADHWLSGARGRGARAVRCADKVRSAWGSSASAKPSVTDGSTASSCKKAPCGLVDAGVGSAPGRPQLHIRTGCRPPVQRRSLASSIEPDTRKGNDLADKAAKAQAKAADVPPQVLAEWAEQKEAHHAVWALIAESQVANVATRPRRQCGAAAEAIKRKAPQRPRCQRQAGPGGCTAGSPRTQ